MTAGDTEDARGWLSHWRCRGCVDMILIMTVGMQRMHDDGYHHHGDDDMLIIITASSL